MGEEGDNRRKIGKGHQGTCINDPLDKAKEGRIKGGKWGRGGWGKVVARKWRQVCLNNNKKLLHRKKEKPIGRIYVSVDKIFFLLSATIHSYKITERQWATRIRKPVTLTVHSFLGSLIFFLCVTLHIFNVSCVLMLKLNSEKPWFLLWIINS